MSCASVMRSPLRASASGRPYHAHAAPVSARGVALRCPRTPRPLAPCRSSHGQEDSAGPSSTTNSMDSAPLSSDTEQTWKQHYGEDDTPTTPVNGGLAAGAAVMLALAVAAGPLLGGGPSLAQLEQKAVPLEVALSNQKPTVIEFYASWCEVCKDLVGDETRVQERYGSDINFVMLNIDNTKWAPEMAEYGVGGVPHFVFMDGNNEPLAAAVGRLPRKVLEGNVSALAEGRELPFMKAIGEVSERGDRALQRTASPRDHA